MTKNLVWKIALDKLKSEIGEEKILAWHALCTPEYVGAVDNRIVIRISDNTPRKNDFFNFVGERLTKIIGDMGTQKIESLEFFRWKSGDLAMFVLEFSTLQVNDYLWRWVEQEILIEHALMVESLKRRSLANKYGYWDENPMPIVEISTKDLTSSDFINAVAPLIDVVHDKAQVKALVHLPYPLTPRDAASLRRWFTDHLDKYGGAEGVLRVATDTPIKELLGDEENVSKDSAISIHDLVTRMFGDQIEARLLAVLTASLTRHIMPSQKFDIEYKDVYRFWGNAEGPRTKVEPPYVEIIVGRSAGKQTRRRKHD